MERYKILFVDEDLHIAEAIGWAFEKSGYHVTIASNSDDALEALSTHDFNLVITDDLDVLKGAKELDPETMVIVSTASYGVAFAINALQLDAYGYIMKPFDLVELWNRVSNCMEIFELKRSAAQNESRISTPVDRYWA